MKNRYIVMCLLFIGCSGNIFYLDIPALLALNERGVECENIYSIECVAGITGEGAVLEAYSLSDKTLATFLNNRIKKLPSQKGYNKINWEKGKCDFLQKIEGFINYAGNVWNMVFFWRETTSLPIERYGGC